MVYAMNDTYKPAGNNVVTWNGASNVGQKIESGYYFVKVTAGSLTSVDKLVLMK